MTQTVILTSKGNWNIQVDGTKTEVVTGAVTETYKDTKTETVTGDVTETFSEINHNLLQVTKTVKPQLSQIQKQKLEFQIQKQVQ